MTILVMILSLKGGHSLRLILIHPPYLHLVEFGNNFRAGHMKLNLVKSITYETATPVYNRLGLPTVVV